ncbi:PQQ-dependent sugar dehydrogenase [Paraburkholderia phenoliruptrix]|uniref:Sorbosone dehydrogenase family protein n=1 Tax=Paraburkholderia phenoliruptrix TaxID=252970 RepID=A0ABV3W7I4_9BURK|nr:PQQ-dependent sugar dehydrogenase [Paraburkholderia phenoliruptrix]MDR6390810.1 glucose/arabinose dehydrogenase [Paraburkholderia phenoliruptrix]
MPRSIAKWLTVSHLIAALAALLLVAFPIHDAGAASATAVANAAAPVLAVTCQPASVTRPQPILPKGFTEQILLNGCLNQPTAISFTADKSRVFVAEKGGRVWNCDLASSTCTLFADLSSEVCNADDRGLLGLAVDPLNDANVWVLYTTPRGTGACGGNFLTAGQLSLLTASGETKVLPAAGATSQTWCFYYSSHSIGSVVFGSDNKTLYVSAGDGASFVQVDYGQLDNACGDGTNLPQGAFRSQGVSPYSDGVILRITNPGTSTQSVATVANGLRNPFRFARAPGLTDDLYIGNVGWNTWESIDHSSIAGQNFGWPCYEGPNTQPDYQATNYCGSVGGVTAPFFAYAHQSYVSAEDSKGKTCGGRPSGGGPDQNGSVISAIGFTDGTSPTYPAPYDKALYFGDLLRKCIWTMQPPDNTPHTFAKSLQGGPVDLKAGQNGDLFYVDLVTSTVRRITHK